MEKMFHAIIEVDEAFAALDRAELFFRKVKLRTRIIILIS